MTLGLEDVGKVVKEVGAELDSRGELLRPAVGPRPQLTFRPDDANAILESGPGAESNSGEEADRQLHRIHRVSWPFLFGHN